MRVCRVANAEGKVVLCTVTACACRDQAAHKGLKASLHIRVNERDQHCAVLEVSDMHATQAEILDGERREE